MGSEWNSLGTETWDRTLPDLAALPTLECVQHMNQADHAVASAVEAVLPQIAEAVDIIVGRLAQGGHLFYVGAGTSGRLGVLDAVECPPTFNTDPDMVQALIAGGPAAIFRAQEGAEDNRVQGGVDLDAAGARARDTVVGISASGNTPYVLGALEWAQRAGLKTISVSCNPLPAASQVSDVTIAVTTGPEVLMGSTRLKAGTAQKMVLNMLSTASMIRLGKTYKNLIVDMRPSNQKLRDRAVRIVMLAAEVDRPKAEQLIQEAGGDTKVAIAMVLLHDTADAARNRLAEAGHVLARVGEVPR